MISEKFPSDDWLKDNTGVKDDEEAFLQQIGPFDKSRLTEYCCKMANRCGLEGLRLIDLWITCSIEGGDPLNTGAFASLKIARKKKK